MAKVKEEKQGIDLILANLEKEFGLKTSKESNLKVVHSGSYKLDEAMGTGGYPKGKLIEVYGPESSGKSSIVLEAIKEFQIESPNKYVALFDYEHSFDPVYARAIGVNIEKLKLYQPDNQEQGYDLLLKMVENNIVSLVVIDSHTSAIPKTVIEGEMSDATIGLQARNNSKFLGKLKGLLSRTDTTCIAISQIRAAIGSMGETNVSTGGNSWKFYADMRFKIWKLLDKKEELNKTTIDVIKNKCAPPFGQAVINILWGVGFDSYGEILDLAIEKNIVEKSGSWYSLKEDGTKLGQGAQNVCQLFKDNDGLFQDIKKQVLQNEKENKEVLKEDEQEIPITDETIS